MTTSPPLHCQIRTRCYASTMGQKTNTERVEEGPATLAIAALVVVLMLWGGWKWTTRPGPNYYPSDQIVQDFLDNEIRALAKYDEKIRTSGPMIATGKAFKPWVIISPGMVNGRRTGIQCHIPNYQLKRLASIQEGQTVSITGKPTSIMLGIVQVTKCLIQ